jgi:hypothetical protein
MSPNNGGVGTCGGSARAKLRLEIRVKQRDIGAALAYMGLGHLNLGQNPRKIVHDRLGYDTEEKTRLTVGSARQRSKRKKGARLRFPRPAHAAAGKSGGERLLGSARRPKRNGGRE